MLRTLGRSMKRLSKDDREMAQRIAAFALMELKEFKAVFVDPYFAERYAPPLGDMQLPNDAPCEPLKALLDQLASLNVLIETEKLLRGKKLEKGKVRDEGKARAEKEVGFSYTAWDPNVPMIAVAIRLLMLKESKCAFYVKEEEGEDTA